MRPGVRIYGIHSVAILNDNSATVSRLEACTACSYLAACCFMLCCLSPVDLYMQS